LHAQLPVVSTAAYQLHVACAASEMTTMRFSRNQIIGALILIAVLWMVILYRMLFSGA
jgi:hypothetical protein